MASAGLAAVLWRRLEWLPLAGNRSHLTPKDADILLDFDTHDPYKVARVVVNPRVEDSYSIGIAWALLSRVPVIWNDQNLQVVEIWKEFPAAIPLSQYTGLDSIRVAEQKADVSKQSL